eukprot:g38271.t1
MRNINFGAWNVSTLMGPAISEHPEGRTAIIARELKRCQVNPADLSKTHLADEGQLKMVKDSYTFFWKGKIADQLRIHGVGFAIKNKLITGLSDLPLRVNDRLMTICLMLTNNQMAAVGSTCAPNLDSEEVVKETFYANLDKEDKIILGDFNARVGWDHNLFNGAIGRE